jgi:hypothetical protein
MDFAPINAFSRPVVLPNVADRQSVGLRPINDPAQAQAPVSALAVRNGPETRVSTGPRQSDSSADARDDDDPSNLHVKGRMASPPKQKHKGDGDERGASIDVTI